MHDELVKRLKDFAAELRRAEDALLARDAADAIEKLTAYVALYKDGGETAMKVAQEYKAAYIAEHDARIAESKPGWIPVTERLPESSGDYIVSLRPFKGKTDRGYGIGDLSYTTEMFFNKGQMLWVGENESYNAILSAVNTENEYHVTHWILLPEPPKEET